MKAQLAELPARLPGKATPQRPEGEGFVTAFAHGPMSVELCAPVGHDPQTPNAQDEISIVQSGQGEFAAGGERHRFGRGSAFLVPAGMSHRVEQFPADSGSWVVFWGPPWGESATPGD
jgi:mannose-6-phosphate isomerase-like protein (cupin superfamily)